MVNEEREHVGNLPVNVFPISAEGGRGWRGGETILHVLTSKDYKQKGQSL